MPEIDSYTHRERGSSPAARALRSIRERARRRRSGAVALIQVLLYAALVAVIVGGAIGGPALYRAIVGGSEHNTLKANIDRVGQAADDYWGQYAADRDGRRKIDLVEFCNFANSQFTQGEDLTLRTLAVAGAALAATTAQGAAATLLPDGIVIEMLTSGVTGSAAHCPTGTAAAAGAIAVAGAHDIVVGTAALAVGATALATPNAAHAGAATSGTATLARLEAVGLASTKAVWMAQYSGWGAAQVPAGTATTVNDQNEVLVIGGVAPDGTSFCMVKVFDADDRGDIGDYRVARQSGISATAGEHPFAVCTQGAGGTTAPTSANTARHNAGWPEAR